MCFRRATRSQALGAWADLVQRGAVLTSAVNLGELFEPQIFLNALRQQTARVSRVPLDQLKLVSCWDERLLDRRTAPLTLTVNGLILQVRSAAAVHRSGRSI